MEKFLLPAVGVAFGDEAVLKCGALGCRCDAKSEFANSCGAG